MTNPLGDGSSGVPSLEQSGQMPASPQGAPADSATKVGQESLSKIDSSSSKAHPLADTKATKGGKFDRLTKAISEIIETLLRGSKKQETANEKTAKIIVSFNEFMNLPEKERENYDFDMNYEEYQKVNEEMREKYALYSLSRSLKSDNPERVQAAIREIKKRIDGGQDLTLVNSQLMRSDLKKLYTAQFENLLEKLEAHEKALVAQANRVAQEKLADPLDKQALRDRFNDLAKKAKQLNSDEGEKYKLVFSKGEFEIKHRKLGKESHQGRSEKAKQTVIQALGLLDELLKNDCFVQEDLNVLQELKLNLQAVLKSAIDRHGLKDKFDQVFANIFQAHQTKPFPKAAAKTSDADRYISTLKAGLTKDNYLEGIFDALFKSDDAYKLQDDFVKGGPWIKLTTPENLEKLLDKMISVFKDGNKNEKTRAVMLLSKLLNREMIDPTNGKLQDVFTAAENINDPGIKGFVQKIKADLNNKLSAPPAPKPAEIVYQARDNQAVSLRAQLDAIAKGTLTGEKRKTFIQQFAQDLTTMDATLFKAIKPSEFHRQAWAKEKAQTTSPYLTAMTQNFNDISNLIYKEVLNSELTEEERQRVVLAFLEVADQMMNVQPTRDYNGAIAIFTAISSNPISRLKHIFEDQEVQALFDNLSTILNPSGGFITLRKRMEKEGRDFGEGSHSMIPWIGLYLKDMTAGDEGNPDLENQIPNLDKAHKFASWQARIESMQETFRVNQELYMVGWPSGNSGLPQTLQEASKGVSENDQYNKSYQISPRQSS